MIILLQAVLNDSYTIAALHNTGVSFISCTIVIEYNRAQRSIIESNEQKAWVHTGTARQTDA